MCGMHKTQRMVSGPEQPGEDASARGGGPRGQRGGRETPVSYTTVRHPERGSSVRFFFDHIIVSKI
jgi:hypothetical protein